MTEQSTASTSESAAQEAATSTTHSAESVTSPDTVVEQTTTQDNALPPLEIEIPNLTAPSEDELRGFDPDVKTEEQTTESKTASSEPSGEQKEEQKEETKSAEEEKEDETKTETDTKAASEEDGKEEEKQTEKTEKTPDEVKADLLKMLDPKDPPRGWVPTAAVNEARGENRYLKGEISKLQAENAELQRAVESTRVESVDQDQFADFKVMSSADYAELAKEDPAQALIYQHQLIAYNAHQDKVAAQKAAAQEIEREEGITVGTAYTRMEDALPGLFDSNTEVAAELAKFADGIGFGEELFFLTNPNTRIVTGDSGQSRVLGNQAAELIEMLVGLKGRLAEQKPIDRDAVVKEVREELRAEITEEVQKELLAKFKSDSDAQEFSSVADLQGTEATVESSYAGKMLSAAELAKLSPAEQERYLSGA